MLKGGFVGLRKRFRMAFGASLGQPLGHVGASLIWRNQAGRSQVLEMVCYQDGYKFDRSPEFFRAAVNFRPPPRSLPGFWSERDEIDRFGPNANIEITVMPEESEALARWLPFWLQHREGVYQGLPKPPDGMRGLLRWKTEYEHVYFWSEQANTAYLKWKEEQCLKVQPKS